MGLDLFAYKVHAPSQDDLKDIITLKDAEKEYGCISQEDIEENKSLYEDLRHYVTKKELITSEYNYEKLAKDYPNFDYIVGMHGKYAFLQMKDKSIIWDVDMDKYIQDRKRIFYLFHKYEIRYWRKAYDLLDIIQDYVYPKELENCGWYYISKDNWDTIKSDLEKHLDNLQYDIDFCLENLSEIDKQDLKQRIDKLEDTIAKIPNEGCFFVAWW